MNERPTNRKPLFFIRPKKTATVEEVADELSDFIIEQVNEDRRARGLPPLPKE
jgi:hypothetical protein